CSTVLYRAYLPHITYPPYLAGLPDKKVCNIFQLFTTMLGALETLNKCEGKFLKMILSGQTDQKVLPTSAQGSLSAKKGILVYKYNYLILI
ncbi:MAG: hypothetical protein R6T92_02575, partial [Desulfosalsimonadaceae bacterium]